MARTRKKRIIKRIALERIYRLFELAEHNFETKEFSKRYIQLALRIAKRYNVRLPLELKLKFCKNCHSILKIGKNAKLRISKTMFKLTCLECGFTRKIRANKGRVERKAQA